MSPETNAQTPAIEFRDVFVSFDDHLVLNNLSFTLDQGEMIFFTGVSGSGKSVLLRLAISHRCTSQRKFMRSIILQISEQ